MMSFPLVSIVIPTYNRAKYLKRALNSAVAQSYQDCEIIVCDNASSDNTKKIVENFQNQFRKGAIRYIRHESNIGPVRNWFSGIEVAQGEYIKILFSDDFLYKNCVKSLVRALHGTFYAFSYGKVSNIWAGSSVTNYMRIRPGNKVSMEGYIGALFSPYHAFEDYPNSPCAALFRNDILRRIPLNSYSNALGYDVIASGIGPDMLMFLYSYLLADGEAIYVNEKVAVFEGHEESITITSGMEKLDTHTFASILHFYNLIPPVSEMACVIEKYFDQLAGEPFYFRSPQTRLTLLLESGYYIPTSKKSTFPVIGAVLFFLRRVQRAVEFRGIRITRYLARKFGLNRGNYV